VLSRIEGFREGVAIDQCGDGTAGGVDLEGRWSRRPGGAGAEM
jgi:hypothetical protein